MVFYNYKDIVLKPLYEQNINYVKETEETFFIQQDKNNTVLMNSAEFKDFITSLINNMTYLAQAFIESNTKSGWQLICDCMYKKMEREIGT